MAAIALVSKVVFALLRTDFGEGFGDCCDERFDGSGGDLSQQGFEFSEELFDGVEVWAVRGQVAQLGAGGLDGFADAGDFVAGEIVHHNHIALAQDRDHELLDTGSKARPIHRSVETSNTQGAAISPTRSAATNVVVDTRR